MCVALKIHFAHCTREGTRFAFSLEAAAAHLVQLLSFSVFLTASAAFQILEQIEFSVG